MPSSKHFESKIGKTMTTVTWLLVLGLLTLVFNRFLESEQNPNQTPQAFIAENNRKVVVLKMNRSGHYVTSGKINQVAVEFLLDTGATDVAISEKLARKLNLKIIGQSMSQTANGVVPSYRAVLDSVTIGNITLNNIRASIFGGLPGDEVLLGMSFLKQLEMVQKGKTLTLIQRS